MITVRKLRYFDILARQLHFGKAAMVLSISQPALSVQIRDLEEDLGVRLFERRTDGVTLTREGATLLEQVRKLLVGIDQLADHARQMNGLSGQIRIGVIPTIGPFILPRLLPQLLQRYPELKPSILETRTLQLIEALEDGRVDLVIVAMPLAMKHAETLFLFDDPFYLAIHESQTPGDVKKIIEENHLLLLEEGHCLRDQALNHCDAAGIRYGEVLGTSNISTLVELVANGLGVTLVPKLAEGKAIAANRVRLVPFAEPAPYRQIGLAWRSSSPLASHYREIGSIIIEEFA